MPGARREASAAHIFFFFSKNVGSPRPGRNLVSGIPQPGRTLLEKTGPAKTIQMEKKPWAN
jgi:hypothetical protein